jgi:hypothetical protein
VYNVELSSEPIKIEYIPVQESREAFDRHKKYFHSIHPRFSSLLYNAIGLVKKLRKCLD